MYSQAGDVNIDIVKTDSKQHLPRSKPGSEKSLLSPTIVGNNSVASAVKCLYYLIYVHLNSFMLFKHTVIG